MKNSRKAKKNILVLLILIITVSLLITGVSALADHTPKGIQGYALEDLSGDVAVEMRNKEILASVVKIELCIEMPTMDYWNPYATLTIKDSVIHNVAVDLIDPKNPETMKSQNRCYLFTFPVTAENLMSEKGTIKLDKLWLELGNGHFSDAVVAEVNARLSDVAPGVEFEVITNIGDGGGGVYIEVISKPENMSKNDVVMLINELSIDELSTNWEMEIDLR